MTTKFVNLTHLNTGKQTRILAESVTCVRETVEGKTLVLFADNQGQYVAESVEYVTFLIDTIINGVNEGEITN